MKTLIHSLSIIGKTGLTIAILLENKPANASTFAFYQSGWDGNAKTEVTGTFSGYDKDGDNIISYDPDNSDENEIYDYEMTFAGHLTFDEFTHTMADLFMLEYMLEDSSAVIVSLGDTSNYDSDGFIQQDDQPNAIATSESVSIQNVQVPEPRSWIGLMLFSLGAYCKRKTDTGFFD